MNNQINLLLTFALVAIGFVNCTVATAAEPPHPYHVSLAEVNWNSKSQKFEVALCLWPADLEQALTQQVGRPIDLAKEPDVDHLMEAYIAKRFTIHSTTNGTEQVKEQKSPADLSANSETGNSSAIKLEKTVAAQAPTATAANPQASHPLVQPPKIKWYGHEADAKQAWVFFEIAGDAKANWTFENRVFFELNDDQLNHVQWSGTGKTETLVCNAANPKIVLAKE